MKELSPLQVERLKYQPKLPTSLREGVNKLELVQGDDTQAIRDAEQIKELFQNTYGKPVVTFEAITNEKTSEIKRTLDLISSTPAQEELKP